MQTNSSAARRDRRAVNARADKIQLAVGLIGLQRERVDLYPREWLLALICALQQAQRDFDDTAHQALDG